MPSDWSRSWDVDRLVAAELQFQGELALHELPRLQDRLLPGAVDRRVAATVRFGKELQMPVAHVSVRAVVPLKCERCSRLVDWPVDAQATLGLTASLADADRVPGGFEPVLAEGGRIVPRELVEEELLLALPLIARHEDARNCSAPEDVEDDIKQKPFAALGELLRKR